MIQTDSAKQIINRLKEVISNARKEYAVPDGYVYESDIQEIIDEFEVKE